MSKYEVKDKEKAMDMAHEVNEYFNKPEVTTLIEEQKTFEALGESTEESTHEDKEMSLWSVKAKYYDGNGKAKSLKTTAVFPGNVDSKHVKSSFVDYIKGSKAIMINFVEVEFIEKVVNLG